MYCPNCDMPRPNDPYFCRECGTQLVAPPKAKKGRLWPPIVFLAVMLAVGITLFALTAESPEPTIGTPWFSVEDGILYFYADEYTGGSNLKIPSTIGGETVTALSEGCFEDCDNLITVELPDTLTAIGNNAFSNCDNLRGIKLTEKIGKIGSRAFADCPSLEAIYVPRSVLVIGEDAFRGCERLRHIFYVGNSMDWHRLYPEEISFYTEIYTVSGPNAETFSAG